MENEKKEKKQNWWTRKKTSAKVGFIIACILALVSIFAIVIIMDLRRFADDEIADMVYGPEVSSGWAKMGQSMVAGIPAWIITAIIVFFTILFIFVVNFITHLFDHGSRKTKTIASLIRSLTKYVAIIAAIAFILIAWGVDVIGIVAGVGVLTLIIGLGCQSLIQDIVSGLFIVFDDYFASGDMVIIDGFRGKVVEVGLKTTKLEDFGGNIKSITNSSITTVVNMSRLRSVCSIKIPVSYNEDVHRVEALILKEIEQLPAKVPNIIEGPVYKGIDCITASSIEFLVLAFCTEDNRFQVTRDLNREFFLMCKDNNIILPYNQVTVNEADPKDRPKATTEQVAEAVKAQNLLRGIEGKQPKKKRTFNSRIKESLDKTKNDLKD